MNEAKKIIEQYFDHAQEATRTLSDLETRAQAIQEQGERRKAAYAEIRVNETNIEQLMQERRELLRFYQEADFEGEVSRKAQITKRRIAIDSEVKKIEKEVDRLHGVAGQNEPDPHDVAELAVALDSVSFPNPYDLAEELKRSLWPQDGELHKRKQATKNKLPSVDTSLYERTRYGDKEYESRQRMEALRREEQAEKGRKLRESIRREELIAAGPVDGRVSTRDLKPWEEDD